MPYATYDTPAEFFGPGYALASSEIKLRTSEHAGTVGTFTNVANLITTSAAHGLNIGHAVTVSSATTLPAPLAAATVYYVKTVPAANQLTLSATRDGAEIALTDTGTGIHTMVCPPLLANLNNALATSSTAQVVFGIVDALYQRFNAIPAADKPAKLSLTRTGYTDETTGELVYSYAITCRVTPGSLVAVNS